jgi:hypothetical protein
MFIGGPSERGHVYTPLSGRGEAAVVPASSPSKAEASAPDAIPLINPAINYDYQSGIAVLEIRDPKTGEVEVQYPSKKVVQEYIRQGAASKAAPSPEPTPDQPPASTGAPPSEAAPVGAATPPTPTPAPPVASPAPAASTHTDQTA